MDKRFEELKEYRKSSLYPNKPEQKNGFYFVPVN